MQGQGKARANPLIADLACKLCQSVKRQRITTKKGDNMSFWKTLFGASARSTPPPTAEDLPASHYASKEYGLSFTVPAGIKLYTSGTPGASKYGVSAETPIVVANPSLPYENVKIKVADGVSADDLVEFKAMLDRTPQMPLPRYKRVSVAFCKVGRQDDKPAVEHVFFEKGQVYGKLRQLTFQHEGRGFTVTCGTSEERFESANQAFFGTVLTSLEFTPLSNRGTVDLIPLANRTATPIPQALDRLVRALRSAEGTRFRVGPHPDPKLKRSLCFLGGDFAESSENLPAALVALGERINDRKAVLAELERLVGQVSNHVPITHVGEMPNDAEHLVLQASSGASVLVDRSRFDYLWAAHPSCKVLLTLPSRAVVAFISGDGNDGLLLTAMEHAV
jgi:hypothetical protein